MEDWKPFFDGVRSDWQGIVINAAVLLNANVAFLALPGVFNPNATDSSGSASQNAKSALSILASSVSSSISNSDRVHAIIAITSQVSMILSLSSIIVGLSLLKISGSGRARSEQGLYHFVGQYRYSRVGLYAAAVKFSIPYVLLMYSTIAFVLALTTLTVTSQIHTVVWIFSVVGVIITALASYAMFGTWEVKVAHSIKHYFERNRRELREISISE